MSGIVFGVLSRLPGLATALVLLSFGIGPAHAGEDVPVPMPRPEPGSAPTPDTAPMPRAAEMPADEKACRALLLQLGVEFRERAQLRDSSGCSVEWPVEVETLGAQVKLAPAGTFNCAIALRSAEFMRDVVVPKSREMLGSPVVQLNQASSYVCRPRNGTSKLSEHAFGNALDIESLILADKRSVSVGREDDDKAKAFTNAVREAACGPFTTVLGPGSDADHATHFHFDLAQRRAGSTYCR